MNKRIVLITGTSRGIGRSLAQHFLRRGDTVIGCSRSGQDLLGADYADFAVNLYDEASVKYMFSEIRQRYGKLDILVNNAGIGISSLVVSSSISDVENVLKTNFSGTFLCCREAVKIMMRAKFGRIINLSSIAVQSEMIGSGIYSASKAAVEQFSKVLAKEVADLGITCNIVAPALVDTDMLRSLSDIARKRYLSVMTVKRPIIMNDIINAVEFFANEQSGMITGQRLALNSVE